MQKVFVLPDHVASQIAAGEVVERPASVVKELVENSIDAGATSVHVSAQEGCRNIRVADNGFGMLPEDAVLAFQRHATSKLRSANDLWTLSTLGFRGEALPSISSVSRMTCYTRPRGSKTGTKVESMDGKVTATETGSAEGTVMEVVDLFYNVPARLKFLKKGSTEFASIQDVMQSLAIAYPEISFELTRENERTFKTTGSGDRARAIQECKFFTGKEALLQVNSDDPENGIKVTGVVARPLHFRGDRKAILSVVNRRPVRCPLTYKALEYAYSDLLPRGRHPLAVIVVELSSDQVDVNIHPTKKEIKYGNGNEVYMTVQRAIMSALRRDRTSEIEESEPASRPAITLLTPDFSPPESTVYGGDAGVIQVHERLKSAASRQLGFRERLASELRPIETGARHAVAEELQLPAHFRLVGYLHNTYILLETEDGLEIVEQHIAHERTLYERLLSAQKQAGRVTDHSQHLVISAPLELTTEQKETLAQSNHVLSSLGFEFERSEDGGWSCTQVPLELAHKSYSTVIQELLDQLSLADHANLELEATKSIACQSAIKNGMPLSEADIIKLLADWNATARNDTCPHGRPVRLRFSMERLFQLFHPA